MTYDDDLHCDAACLLNSLCSHFKGLGRDVFLTVMSLENVFIVDIGTPGEKGLTFKTPRLWALPRGE